MAILNAGIGFAGDPKQEEAGSTRQIFDVNVLSAVFLAQALAGRLEAAGGKIVLIGSVAWRGSDRFASYAASKASLHGLARALRLEWRGRIGVQVLHPGPTATPMHSKAGYYPGRMKRWYFTPQTMAGMLCHAMDGNLSPLTLSYRYFAVNRLAIGSVP